MFIRNITCILFTGGSLNRKYQQLCICCIIATLGSSKVCARAQSAFANLEILIPTNFNKTPVLRAPAGQRLSKGYSHFLPNRTPAYSVPANADHASKLLAVKMVFTIIMALNHSYQETEHSTPASLRKQAEAFILFPLASPEPFSLASLPQLSPTYRAWHKFREPTGCLCPAQPFRAKLS
jgi:hypothetical protein